jgi:hypothetical protein
MYFETIFRVLAYELVSIETYFRDESKSLNECFQQGNFNWLIFFLFIWQEFFKTNNLLITISQYLKHFQIFLAFLHLNG